MEEVPKDCRSGILRGIVLGSVRRSPDTDYNCQKNNRLVWDETIRIMMDLFDNVWGEKSEVVVEHCVDVTLPVRSPMVQISNSPHVPTSPSDCSLRH